jgi:hypothetical protein
MWRFEMQSRVHSIYHSHGTFADVYPLECMLGFHKFQCHHVRDVSESDMQVGNSGHVILERPRQYHSYPKFLLTPDLNYETSYLHYKRTKYARDLVVLLQSRPTVLIAHRVKAKDIPGCRSPPPVRLHGTRSPGILAASKVNCGSQRGLEVLVLKAPEAILRGGVLIRNELL